MRRLSRLVIGNWKMHLTQAAAAALAGELRERIGAPGARPLHGGAPGAEAGAAPGVNVALAPPFTALAAVARALSGSPIMLCGQAVHAADAGAFTGSIAAPQLRDAGCTFVLVGHSERRLHCHETPADTGQQVAAALRAGLRPVLCVGESLAERDAGRAEATVTAQLAAGLVGALALDQIVVAYEPVWAIGTGRAATPAQAAAMHAHVRGVLRGRGASGDAVPLLYGGSVRPESTAPLLAQPEIDGVLVGGASLDAAAFAGIVAAANG